MRVLVACEFSGVVRDAFLSAGHDALSCDLLPSEREGPHYQGNVLAILDDGWDLMVAHPPCTYLACSGMSWYYHPDDKHLPKEVRRPHPRFPKRASDKEEAVGFFMALVGSSIPQIAVENPIGIMSTRFRKPDQIIQPWQFGHETTKATCLWLKNLPLLKPTNIVGHGTPIIAQKSGKADPVWHTETRKLPKVERQKARSVTFAGIAQAMAQQWACEEWV